MAVFKDYCREYQEYDSNVNSEEKDEVSDSDMWPKMRQSGTLCSTSNCDLLFLPSPAIKMQDHDPSPKTNVNYSVANHQIQSLMENSTTRK